MKSLTLLGACLASLILPAYSASTTAAASRSTTKPETPPEASAGLDRRVQTQFQRLPLSFEPNVGQAPEGVRFVARSGNLTALLKDTETWLVTHRRTSASCSADEATRGRDERCPRFEHAMVRMRVDGARPPAAIAGARRLPGVANYFLGDDPARWRKDVPTYAAVRYTGIYEGVDLVFHGNQQELEYDFEVQPGADPAVIQLAFEGVRRLRTDPRGDLILTTALGDLRQRRPLVYQWQGDRRQAVAARYRVLPGRRVAFEIAGYDRSRPLTIDPVLLFSTYLGGDSAASAVAVDTAGAAYVSGSIASAFFPATQAAYDTSFNGNADAFVAKFNPAGTALEYATYLGTAGDDYGVSIAVDSSRAAYLLGATNNAAFPVRNPYQGYRGDQDAFVVKLNAAGNDLVYATYLGSTSRDEPGGIAVDFFGAMYITGSTYGANYPIANAFQAVPSTLPDAVITKLQPAGAVAFSTYVGGSASDFGRAIAVDGSYNVYVVGATASSDFPSRLPHQTFAGEIDAFLLKLSFVGNTLVYGTFLGGANADYGTAVAVDRSNHPHVGGYTLSSDFPVTAVTALSRFYQAGTDGFLTKYNQTGSGFLYSGYLRGFGNDYIFGVAVDSLGAAYATGQIYSANFPSVAALQDYLGEGDAFVFKLSPAGDKIVYATPLGGRGDEYGAGIAVDELGYNAYVAGFNNGGEFPVVNAIQPAPGRVSAFVLKLSELTPVTIDSNIPGRTFQVTSQGGCEAGTYTTPKALLWAPGTICAIAFPAEQPAPAGARYVFDGWQNAPPTVGPAVAATYTANFRTQYLLQRAVSPLAGGSLNVTPAAADGYYNAGTQVQLQAAANSGYAFAGFSGDAAGTAALIQIAMTGPRSVTALFSLIPGGGGPGAAYRFVPVTPCRVADTRPGQGTTGAFGPPSLGGGQTRRIPVPASPCGIPANAQAYSLNVTVVPAGPLSYLSIWPAGQPQPFVSTLNSFQGEVVANAAIVPAGASGALDVFVTDATDLIIDVNGYFTSTAGLQFYPVTPCRVADTRSGEGKAGAFGPPRLGAGGRRDLPVPLSGCGVPAGAQAYSVNVTVVPPGPMAYLSLWPTGQNQPLVSTLNSFAGAIVANAAIVPAGTGGAISVFVSDPADVIVDINGYFAPPGAGGLNFAPVTPCRVADTRTNSGFGGAFGAPTPAGGSTRTMPVPSGGCGLPATARAYAFNVTVVPPGPLAFLTAWPAGLPQPLVSTLNSFRGLVVANAAIVPAGTNGAVSFFVTDPANLIVDVNGYFGP